MNEERETKEESCGTGFTGTQTFQRSRRYVMREYSAPVPFVADVRVSEEPWLDNWLKTGDTCRRIPTNTTNDDDDDDNTPFHTPRTTTSNGGNTPVQTRSPHKGSTRNNPINVGTSTHWGINP